MNEEISLKDIQQLIEDFSSCAREELDDRLGKWPPNSSNYQLHEVAGALMARQVTLAIEIVKCPTIWNGHVAPIILRAMADVYISLAWVLRDPEDRCKRFIHYGLGQEKLQLEQRRAELATREPSANEVEVLEAIEDWINSQRATFLTEVNLGSWSGISIRKMAEEAECLDFYNFVYAPFSACAHSMWHHIARYNLRQCQNPLHRYHWVPAIGEAPIDPYYLYLAAKYLGKTFATLDRAIGISTNKQSAFKMLRRRLDEFARPNPM